MNQYRNDVNYIEKVLRLYGDLNGELHLVELQRSVGSVSLGLSLAGNRDFATMSVFVLDVAPSSLVGLDGRIHIGDELLEINGHVLYGRSHLNVSAIIKGIASTKLKILLLRDQEFLQRIAVEPVARTAIEYKDSSATLIPRKLKTSDLEEGENTVEDENDQNSDNVSPNTILLSVDSRTLEEPSVEDSLLIVEADQQNHSFYSSNSDRNASVNRSTEIHEASLNQTNAVAAVPKLHLKIQTAAENLTEGRSDEFRDKGISERVNEKLESNHLDANSQEASFDTPPSFGTVVDDPLTCPISTGKPSMISIQKGKQPLGIQVIGGYDTMLISIYIFQIYKDGVAFRDGRLDVGDRILEANGEDLTNVTSVEALQIMRRSSPALRLVVLRDAFQEDRLYDSLAVDLFKKPGKGLGLSIVSNRNDVGILVADIIKGGVAELDGRLMVGDEIISVNGDNICDAKQEYAANLLKTVTGKVSLSIKRLKVGLQPAGLLGSSYANVCPEGSLKKSESHSVDCKSVGRQVTKSLSASKSY